MNVLFGHHGGEVPQWQKRRKGDLPLCMNHCCDSVVHMCLSTPSSAVKEENLFLVIVHQVHDFVKGKLLLRIKVRIAEIDKVSHLPGS